MQMRIRLGAAAGVLAVAMVLSTRAFGQYVGGNPPPAGATSDPGGGGTHSSYGGSHSSHNLSHNSGPADVRVSNGPFVPQSRGFAVTGADILQLVVLAGVCGVVGLVIVRSTRRKATAE